MPDVTWSESLQQAGEWALQPSGFIIKVSWRVPCRPRPQPLLRRSGHLCGPPPRSSVRNVQLCSWISGATASSYGASTPAPVPIDAPSTATHPGNMQISGCSNVTKAAAQLVGLASKPSPNSSMKIIIQGQSCWSVTNCVCSDGREIVSQQNIVDFAPLGLAVQTKVEVACSSFPLRYSATMQAYL